MAENELGKRLREVWEDVRGRGDWPAYYQETVDQALLIVNATAPVARDLARIASAFATQADLAEKAMLRVEQVTTGPTPVGVGLGFKDGYDLAMERVRGAFGKSVG